MSVPAQLIKNKTFVPLRFIAQSLGADVNWNGLTRTITIQSKDLNCGKGSDNGVPVSEDQRLSNDSGIGDFEREVFLLVNEERKKAGLPGLVFDEELSVVAEEKSRDMAENDYFDHQSPTYGSPFEMMEFFGIKYRTAGENIAAGYQTPENVVKAWMNSPGHRANILNKNFKQIGIGYVKVPGSEYVTYWTQMFRAE
ncbi:transporter [Bacillus sp. P2(2020)]|uniref:Transporter n=1 Tax=Calidifontibacillus erzurumensis TaxID=2741433 RepID=A0A8J8GJ52_9BACI|nr:transporter [Calidifontibacillus erzurumensis]